MKKVSIICVMLVLLCAGNASARDFVKVEVGSFKQTLTMDGTFSNGSTLEEEGEDSATVFGFGAGRMDEKIYVTAMMYLPLTEDDTLTLFEIAPHYRFSDVFYGGVTLGYMSYESTDSGAAQSIGADSSTLDMSGMTVGVSFGALFLDGALDINVRSRFINGSVDTLSGQYLGVDYDIDMEIEKTTQFTLGYNVFF